MRRNQFCGTQHSTASRSELRFTWLQCGSDVLRPTVVEQFVLDGGVLVLEGVRDHCFCNVPEGFERLASL